MNGRREADVGRRRPARLEARVGDDDVAVVALDDGDGIEEGGRVTVDHDLESQRPRVAVGGEGDVAQSVRRASGRYDVGDAVERCVVPLDVDGLDRPTAAAARIVEELDPVLFTSGQAHDRLRQRSAPLLEGDPIAVGDRRTDVVEGTVSMIHAAAPDRDPRVDVPVVRPDLVEVELEARILDEALGSKRRAYCHPHEDSDPDRRLRREQGAPEKPRPPRDDTGRDRLGRRHRYPSRILHVTSPSWRSHDSTNDLPTRSPCPQLWKAILIVESVFGKPRGHHRPDAARWTSEHPDRGDLVAAENRGAVSQNIHAGF